MELAVIFRDYCQQLEGELALNGIDLRECDDPESSFTLRRLYAIMSSLPPRNAVSLAVAKITGEASMWSPDTYVLANVFDAIQQLTYLTQCMNTPKGSRKPPVPKMHPRPGGSTAKPRAVPKGYFPGKTIYVK